MSKFLNLAELVDALDPPTSRETIRRLYDRGFPIARRGVRGQSHLFDLGAAQKWWARYQGERTGPRRTKGIRPGELPAAVEAAETPIPAEVRALIVDRVVHLYDAVMKKLGTWDALGKDDDPLGPFCDARDLVHQVIRELIEEAPADD